MVDLLFQSLCLKHPFGAFQAGTIPASHPLLCSDGPHGWRNRLSDLHIRQTACRSGSHPDRIVGIENRMVPAPDIPEFARGGSLASFCIYQ